MSHRLIVLSVRGVSISSSTHPQLLIPRGLTAMHRFPQKEAPKVRPLSNEFIILGSFHDLGPLSH